MRASKLITISAVAALMGGTSFAIGQGASRSLQSGASTQGPAAIEQGSPETKASRSRAAQNLVRRSERGSRLRLSRLDECLRNVERGRAKASECRGMIGARGQATIEQGQPFTGARAQAMPSGGRLAATAQGAKTATQIQGQPSSRAQQSLARTAAGGLVYARATPSEARIGLTADQRARLREMARRELPRVSHLPEARINAVVPRNVQLAPVPEELARYYPRFRRDQAFMYRNQIVLVDPATSRIVAVLPT
jgi:hypothetical protein